MKLKPNYKIVLAAMTHCQHDVYLELNSHFNIKNMIRNKYHPHVSKMYFFIAAVLFSLFNTSRINTATVTMTNIIAMNEMQMLHCDKTR